MKDPPAIYDAVFSVGAVNSARSLASFSGRGPVTIDGSNRLKPNVSAPGVSVRSSVPGTGYGTSSGTSMASPHATGVMALLWSAKPELKRLIRISRCYLQESAGAGAGTVATCGGTPPASRPNNMFGWGIVDALAAIDLGPDTDHDGIADPCDCDPADGGAFEEPTELGGDRFAAELKTYSWDSVAAATGQGIIYVVGRGLASQLRIDGGFASAFCVSDGQSSPFIVDPQVPPPGEAFYYLARAQNVCGDGSWGAASNGTPRRYRQLPIGFQSDGFAERTTGHAGCSERPRRISGSDSPLSRCPRRNR